MTVNGSLLSDSIINFLIQNKFELSISLDGAETIQNRHRKFGKTGNDTFSVVYKNVLKLRQKDEKYFQENVFFLPVIIEDEKYQGVLDFYEELGVKKDNITPLRANLNGVDYIFSISEQRDIPQLQNMMIDDMERANLEKLQKIFDNKQFLSPKWHHNGQCIPGVQRVFVDTHGKFFPCEKITEDKTFSIGDLEQGFDNDKIVRFLNIGKLTEEECKTCWAMRFCDMCVSQCNDIDKKKLTKEQKLITCKFQKEKTLSFFKYYINNRFKCFL